MTADKALDNVNKNSEELSEFEKLLKLYDYNFNKGDIVKGKVIGYESHGALIDIGAKTTAIVPGKELPEGNIKTPQDILKIGDERDFLIIKEEDEEGRLTLSLKKVLIAHSWKKIEELQQQDAVVEGVVTSVVKGGILVEVMNLRGFVPSSHIRSRDPESLIGQTIPLKILSVDPQENNLILSHKKVVSEQQAEQRKDVFTRLSVGQVVEGEVVRLADFGAFIDIGGIDGLLPLSQMSWRWVDHPADLLTVGSKISVEIIGIDPDKQRVSLSLKSLQPDPWEEATKIIKEGDTVTGKVIRVKHFGAFVEVYPGVEALLPYQEMLEYQNKTGTTIETGKEIEANVIRFNPEDRRISLSFSKKNSDQEQSEGANMIKDKKPKEEPKAEPEEKKEAYQSDEETQEPDETDNPGVTHISPPCNEG